jgi:hypothetical protein
MNTCPKCGAADADSNKFGVTSYGCGSYWRPDTGKLEEGVKCLRRQLAAAQAERDKYTNLYAAAIANHAESLDEISRLREALEAKELDRQIEEDRKFQAGSAWMGAADFRLREDMGKAGVILDAYFGVKP